MDLREKNLLQSQMICHVVLHEGRIHQKPVLFLGTFLRCNHNHSQMDTTCLGSIHVCCPSTGDAPHGIILSSPAITVPVTSIYNHLLISQPSNSPNIAFFTTIAAR